MSGPKPNLDSLLAAAVKIVSAAEREAFVKKSCGDDLQLRQDLERLLRADQRAGSANDEPPATLVATIRSEMDTGNKLAGSDARTEAPFDGGCTVAPGNTGQNVLNMLGHTLGVVPRVRLRESTMDAVDPIVQSEESRKRVADSRYRIESEIARGGMGAILKGHDTDLGRDLAIKVLLDQHKDNPEVVQRFIEEAQIGGQLQHPGIAPVYELGQFSDQRPFFSMKLVKGQTLAKLLDERKESVAECGKFTGIFEQICQTMAYAHSRGVIHRDLKPANIMVGAFGEVQVMDWGLAKVLRAGGTTNKKTHELQSGQSIIQTLRTKVGSGASGTFDSSGSQTQMGSVMGTPAYMPPEQALGEIDHLDERADVFGLGGILCEILTGKPPYVGSNGTEVFRLASRGKLTDCFTRLDACGIDAELIAIAKHCLSPDPADRPRDASVLAERITRHLMSVETRLRATELERAEEAARAEEALRTVAETSARAKAETRAKRWQLMVATIGLIAVSIGGLAAFWSALSQRDLTLAAEVARQRAESERQLADEARQKADELRLEAEAAAVREQKLAIQSRDAQQREAEMRNIAEERERITEATLYASQMNLAAQAADESSGLRRVGEIVDAWKPDRAIRDLRGWEWYYLDSLRQLARSDLPNHSSLGMCWNPDGNRYVTFGRDSVIRVWDYASGEQLFESVGHTHYVHDVSWNPAGTLLASAGRDSVVRIWNANDGSPLGAPIECSAPACSVRWNPDGTRLAIQTENEAIVCSVENRQVIHRWPTLPFVLNLSWHPRLDRLAIPHAVVDTKSGETLWSHAGDFVQWNSGGTQLAAATSDRVWILSAEDGSEQLQFTVSDGSVQVLDWNPAGDAIAFGKRDSTVSVLSTQTGLPLALLRGHATEVTDVRWSHDGTLLASTSRESTKLWDWPPRTNPSVIQTTPPTLSELSWTPDGKSIISANEYMTMWHRDSLKPQSSIALGGQPFSRWSPCVTWSHTSGTLARQRDDKLVLLDSQSGDLRKEIPHNCVHLRSLALNADGTRLATSTFRAASADSNELGEICLYDTESGTLVWQQELIGDRAGGLAWSPDGRRLACNGWLGVEILNADDGSSLASNYGEYELAWVNDMSWSPDGERIALGYLNHTVRIIETSTGRVVNKLVGHTGPVTAVSWSPDGQRIATSSEDKTVRIWNPQSGYQVLVLKNHQAAVNSVAWSPDSKQLASGTFGGEVLIWDTRVETKPLAIPPAVETLASAEQELQSLVKLLAEDDKNTDALLAQGSLLARLGRWSECADAYVRLTELDPESRTVWGIAATPMLMAGETDRYRKHCLAMVEQFRGTTAADVADTVCKTALLLPDTVPLTDLPIQTLRDAADDPQWAGYRPWFAACCALISYREGQPAEAINWTTRMPDFQGQSGTLALTVRAMSEQRLGQLEVARETLRSVELQIPLALRTLGTVNDATPLPVTNGIQAHDWLVPELLRREAAELLK